MWRTTECVIPATWQTQSGSYHINQLWQQGPGLLSTLCIMTSHPAAKNEQMCDSSFMTDPDDIQGSSALNDIHWYEQGRANVWFQSNHDRPSRDHLCSDKHIKQRHEQQVQGVQIQSGLSSLHWLYQHTSFPKTVHYQLVTAAVFTKYWVLSTWESRTGD